MILLAVGRAQNNSLILISHTLVFFPKTYVYWVPNLPAWDWRRLTRNFGLQRPPIWANKSGAFIPLLTHLSPFSLKSLTFFTFRKQKDLVKIHISEKSRSELGPGLYSLPSPAPRGIYVKLQKKNLRAKRARGGRTKNETPVVVVYPPIPRRILSFCKNAEIMRKSREPFLYEKTKDLWNN